MASHVQHDIITEVTFTTRMGLARDQTQAHAPLIAGTLEPSAVHAGRLRMKIKVTKFTLYFFVRQACLLAIGCKSRTHR